MKTHISLLITSLLIASPPAFSTSCKLPPIKEKKILAMPYNDFDQAKNGWRKYTKAGCYHEAGKLIDKYLEQNKTILIDWQRTGVTWHAGQLYALNNEYKIAKIRFIQSINPNEPKDTHILWNDYVYATLAFINHDMPKLTLYRNKIANGPLLNGKNLNLAVVDRLIQHFGEPYSVAYLDNK